MEQITLFTAAHTDTYTYVHGQAVGGASSHALGQDLFVITMLTLLLAQTALVDVLQRVSPLQGEVSQADAGQRVLLRVHPRLQVRVVLPLPLRVFLTGLVDPLHSLVTSSSLRAMQYHLWPYLAQHPDTM